MHRHDGTEACAAARGLSLDQLAQRDPDGRAAAQDL
jgi:hypothetical protein